MNRDAGELLAAAIDIGSNSIKMTIGRANGHGGIEQLAWASEVVRLGEGVAASGRLDERRIEAAIETLRRFAAQARGLGATTIVAVATEATRSAVNSDAFLDRVQEEAGIDVRVIDGDEEAMLTFRGLASELDLGGSALIADIGGGSTELIATRLGAMAAARSLSLGSGALTERLVHADPPDIVELAACEEEAARVVAAALPSLDLPADGVSQLVLVGGTGEYLMRLLPDGRSANLPALRDALAMMTSLTAANLAERIAVPEARAKVLPAGVAIVAAVAEQVTPEAIEIAHSGLRAGLLLDALQESAIAGGSPGRHAETRRRRNSTEKPTRQPNADSDGLAVDEDDFRETMKALIAARWDAVWAAIPVALEGEDIEGVHDVRVASRRLRAAMDIAAPVFPRPWYRALHRTAKEITRALGEVRDRDVLLEAIRADRAAAPVVEHPGIDRLIDRLERERVAAREDMEAYLEDLLAGPVRQEVEHRFASGARRPKPAAGMAGATA